MSKISQAAQQQLTKDDSIVQQYRSIYNRTEGALFLTKQRVLFIQPQGFLQKTYHVSLNLPYDTITKTTVDASHRFTVTTANNAFTFATIGIQADIVDYNQLRTGQARAGLHFALWGMSTKLALAAAAGHPRASCSSAGL